MSSSQSGSGSTAAARASSADTASNMATGAETVPSCGDVIIPDTMATLFKIISTVYTSDFD